MTAGSLTYDTKLDTSGFKKGINDINNQAQNGGTKMKSIIGALGITKLVSTAFNTITNSMDSAISRLDTMNNFPKVMSNLNISAEDSTKAVKKLSEGLQGIPTTLDAGALAVQRFTSKNGDVQKSVDIFLAVNDAILAGGASTQIQETALEQLSQAYAKGKMDMVEWRTLQTAMPAQLKQVASAMGVTTDELGEMMRQGDNTSEVMDSFIETIIRLDREGGDGIKSFAEQSRNATGGIQTNITNMKTAIARGLANIISSLDKALKKANLKGIGESIKSIGQTAEKWLNKISKAIENIDFKSLLDILKKLVPIVGTVVTAFVAYETTLKAIQMINTAKNIASMITQFISLIPTITSTNMAMVALNTTMSISPIGIIVSAIAGLTAGLYLLSKATQTSASENEKITKTLNDYDLAMKEANKTRQEYLDTNMNEIQNTENLYNELQGLVDANGRVKEGYEDRANFIINELNSALGTEITMTNGVIDNYNDMKKSVNDVIQSKRAKVLLDAQESVYNKAKDESTKLEKNYANAVKEVITKEKERNDVLKQIQSTYGLTKDQLQQVSETLYYFDENGRKVNITFDDLGKKLSEANNHFNISNATLEQTRQKYAENQSIIGNYEQALTQMSNSNYEAVLKMYEDTTNYQGKTNEETQINYNSAIQSQQNYLQYLKDNKDKYNADVYNAEVEATNQRIAKLQEEQDKMNATISTGQSNIKSTWKKGLADQLSELTGHTVAFKKTADGHIQAYIDGQRQGAPMSKKEAEKFGKDMAKEIDKAKSESKTAGKNIIDGTTQGINNRSSQNSAFSAISNFGSSLLSKLKSSLKEHSPSKATEEMGINAILGTEIGIDKEKPKALKKIETFGDEVLDRFSNAVNIETGKMSFNGTNGSVTEILSANASFEGTIPLQVDLDGEKIYNNQQKISARKTLQYGGTK